MWPENWGEGTFGFQCVGLCPSRLSLNIGSDRCRRCRGNESSLIALHFVPLQFSHAALIRDDWRDWRASVWVHYSPRITRIFANRSARVVTMSVIEECELISGER